MEPIPIRFNSVANLPVIQTDPSLESYDNLYSPDAVHVRLSAKCQYECAFCERESFKNGDKEWEQDMSLPVWEAIRDKIMPFVKGVEICGLGEPTLHPLFPQIASEIVAAGKVLYFPTNGLSLGSQKILDAIGDTPRVSVSLDAWDEESYKRIRTGDWSKVIAAIRKFRSAKPNAFLHSQFTAGSYNIDGFPQFLQVLVDEGFNEAIMRFVQTHTVAREDVSLRFAKERTEKAIYAAQLIAEKAGLPLTVERRPYSEFNPESVQDTSPESKLARYLDFVPMENIACPSGCTTSTIVPLSTYTVTSGVDTYVDTTLNSLITCTDSAGYCYTTTNLFQVQDLSGTLGHIIVTLGIYCDNTTTISSGSFITLIVCVTQMTTFTFGSGTGSTSTLTSSTSPVCSTIVTTCPPGTTFSNLTFATIIERWVCNGGCSTGLTTQYTDATDTGTCIAVTTCGGIPGGTRACTGGLSEAGPEIVQTVQVIKSASQPLGYQFTAMSTGVDTKPIIGTPASIIAWHDGTLTSCFAMHEVGNVLTNTWDQVIKNPRYQAFLHRRAETGGAKILDESWCASCPRNY